MSDKLLEIKLKPGQEDRLLAGHAWIFSNELEPLAAPIEPGALVLARTAGGKSLGVGFYNPASLIAFRSLSREEEVLTPGFFRRRLERALDYRGRLYPGESSYRLCFGESDALPGLVVDRYGDYLVVSVLSAGMERCLTLISEALTSLLSPRGIFLKNDHRTRSLEGLSSECRVLAGEVPERVEIAEGGLRYLVQISGGQKTGFYFDQRENREFLRPYFKGRKILDAYCYTGAFALNAARHGAESVLAIDSSEAAIALARENAALNSLEVKFDASDAEGALEAFAGSPARERPGMILLDPPNMAPNKKSLPKALRALVKLNAAALQALPSGGLLATSTCSHHVSRELLVSVLRQASQKARRPARLLALRGQSLDHPRLMAMPETEYLHFALLELL